MDTISNPRLTFKILLTCVFLIFFQHSPTLETFLSKKPKTKKNQNLLNKNPPIRYRGIPYSNSNLTLVYGSVSSHPINMARNSDVEHIHEDYRGGLREEGRLHFFCYSYFIPHRNHTCSILLFPI